MGASLSTVRRMEKGDIKVPIHFFARALHVFGEIRALEHLLDTPNDEIGLTLMDEHLPKRIRSKSGGLRERCDGNRHAHPPTRAGMRFAKAGLPPRLASFTYNKAGARIAPSPMTRPGWPALNGSTSLPICN